MHGPKDEDTCSEPGGEPQSSKRPDTQNRRAGVLTSANQGPQGANGLRLRLPAKTTWRP